jgi:ferredoxin
MARTPAAPSSTACRPSRSGSSPTRRRCTSRRAACTAKTRPACRCAPPAPATSAPKDGIVLVDYDKCIGCKYCSWACPYGAREFDEERKVMSKCTLCVDRVTSTTLPEPERKPACVLACPAGRAPVRRCARPGLGGLGGHPRTRRLPADAGMEHAPGQPLPAAAAHQCHRAPRRPGAGGQPAQDRRPATRVAAIRRRAGRTTRHEPRLTPSSC